MSGLSQSVPVSLEDSWAGFAQNSGLLRLDPDALVLEFETKDGVLELLKSEARQHRVPLAELESCRWQSGWFSGSIELSTRSLATLSGIPGAARGTLILRVRRKDKGAAQGLVASLELALAHRVVRAAEAASAAAHPRL